MTKRIPGLLLSLAFSASVFAQQQTAPAGAQKPQPTQPQAQPAQPQPAPPPQTHLKVGDPAPEFVLRDTEGKEVKLSDFKGKKNVVLAFYVLAFTGG